MKKIVSSVVACVFAVAALVQAETGPGGKWTGQAAGRGGQQALTLDLKVNGSALSGTIKQGDTAASDITGKVVDASTITFSRSIQGRGGRGRAITLNYTGKISGDEMTLTVERPAGGRAARGGGAGGPISLKLKRAS